MVGASGGRLVVWETVDEMRLGWLLMQQMYPAMSYEHYLECLEKVQKHDYRQFAYLDDAGQCRGVMGMWFFPRFWCRLQADIDNFVVDQACRSSGIGKRLLDFGLNYAQERGASVAVLDTFVDNPQSHRFYFREGFNIRGYHFVKALQGQDIWGEKPI